MNDTFLSLLHSSTASITRVVLFNLGWLSLDGYVWKLNVYLSVLPSELTLETLLRKSVLNQQPRSHLPGNL